MRLSNIEEKPKKIKKLHSFSKIYEYTIQDSVKASNGKSSKPVFEKNENNPSMIVKTKTI